MSSVVDKKADEIAQDAHEAKETSALKRKFEVSDDLAKNIVKHARKAPPAGYNDAKFEEAEYYFENGLRKVYPYHFTYSTFCKGRWVGKRLIDIFSTEFRAFSCDQYRKSILSGEVMVNGLKADPEYALKDNDLITNRVHRHEVAVIASPIKIVHLSEELVVVDKPPSIPVHPCGRYRHNSLLFILAKEHGLTDLHTIHRLDRLTSGVMVLTRTLKKSQELDEQVRSHKISKEYLSRVDGLFPDGLVICEKPVEILSPKIGICIVSPSGKKCYTEFERVSYNGKSSMVKCRPRTGRMHQIRVHLQYLGYPIVNDPIYNSEVFGPSKGKDGETGKTREQLLNDLLDAHNLDKWLRLDEHDDSVPVASAENDTILKILKHNLSVEEYKELEEKYSKDPAKFKTDSTCEFCRNHYKDPEPKDLILFLHAFRYKGDVWEFETELPVWAKDDWLDM